MTRTLKASLLIASMLVVLWTTSSQACHFLRRACQPPRATANRGTATGAPRATTLLARAATARLAAVTMVAGIPAERPAIPARTGTASPDTYDFGRPGYNPGGLGGPAPG